MIADLVTNDQWKPVSISRNGPALSDLFFADDIILFAEATIDQIVMIKKCLEKFCEWSEQRMGFNKSQRVKSLASLNKFLLLQEFLSQGSWVFISALLLLIEEFLVVFFNI